ncbi:hypothetical protein RJ55_01607 [Drechmeria coniospora]|nr:hypothetical protein RJ55_01607 [Drechmeria coniospora]
MAGTASMTAEIQLHPLVPTRRTHYVQMLLEQDEMPVLHNMLVSLFVWLLLAGFLVFPAIFTSIQRWLDKGGQGDWGGQATETITKGVKNIPLLVLAAVACGISIVGIASLGLRHMDNFVWLINKLLFLPGVANSLVGLISTLIGVYSQQHGNWSITANVTAIVEGSYLVVSGVWFLGFDRFLLQRVKDGRDEHYEQWPGDGSEVANTVPRIQPGK